MKVIFAVGARVAVRRVPDADYRVGPDEEP